MSCNLYGDRTVDYMIVQQEMATTTSLGRVGSFLEIRMGESQ